MKGIKYKLKEELKYCYLWDYTNDPKRYYNYIMQTEIDYPLTLIRRVTPYLDNVTYLKYHRDKGEYDAPLTNKQRAFSWYYVYNGGNKTDAFRRSYYSEYSTLDKKLIPDTEIAGRTLSAGGYRLYKKPQVQKAIALIREGIENKIKTDIPQTILEQLQIQASYDPAMFITPTGKPTFTDWEDIPLKYRCCVIGIETRHYGINGHQSETIIKLADRPKARKELQALVPGLIKPTEIDMRIQQIGADGQPIAPDLSHKSDAELLAIIDKGNII